jgi:hypothetical protein
MQLDTNITNDAPTIDQVMATSFGLLLPFPHGDEDASDNDESKFFAVVDSKWRVMENNGKMVLPHQYL